MNTSNKKLKHSQLLTPAYAKLKNVEIELTQKFCFNEDQDWEELRMSDEDIEAQKQAEDDYKSYYDC